MLIIIDNYGAVRYYLMLQDDVLYAEHTGRSNALIILSMVSISGQIRGVNYDRIKAKRFGDGRYIL
jgi:hypothetical protein